MGGALSLLRPPPRLRNDLYCVEWDVKLDYTIPYSTPLHPCSNRNTLYRQTDGAGPAINRSRVRFPATALPVATLDKSFTCTCTPPRLYGAIDIIFYFEFNLLTCSHRRDTTRIINRRTTGSGGAVTDLDTIMPVVKQLTATNATQDGINAVVHHVVSADGRQRVALCIITSHHTLSINTLSCLSTHQLIHVRNLKQNIC